MIDIEAAKEKLKLTREQLTEMVNDVISVIKGQELKEFLPHIHMLVYNADDSQTEEIMVGLSCDLLNNNEAKESIMKGMANMLIDKHCIPICVILVTEAWMVSRKDLNDKSMPSEDPSREEVIHISALTFLGLTAFTLAKIDHSLNFIDDFMNVEINEWTDKNGSKPFLVRKLYEEFINKIKSNMEARAKAKPSPNPSTDPSVN